jgi:hypothetical protein
VSEKAHQGRMLLTMSLQEIPLQGKQQDDAVQGTDKAQDKKDENAEDKQVWAASVGGILLMLAPLLII